MTIKVSGVYPLFYICKNFILSEILPLSWVLVWVFEMMNHSLHLDRIYTESKIVAFRDQKVDFLLEALPKYDIHSQSHLNYQQYG